VSGATHRRTRCALAACVLAAACAASPLLGQSIEPRSYSNAPIGTSFLVAGLAATQGGLSLDPAVPLTEPDLRTRSTVLGYARFFAVAGKSAKFDVILPYSFLDGSALYAGQPVQREVSGFADPSFRVSVNFLGAPALTAGEFAGYRQDVIVGASLQVFAPLGQYDETRLVNIGTNRWTLKTEVGVSKAIRTWTLELTGAVTVFTDNEEFFHGQTREQGPMYSAQGHVIHNFVRGRWASFDTTWFTGGRTTIAGTQKQDLQRNWRLGATYAFPIAARDSIKLYASRGVSARTGNSFDLLGVAWQRRWS
jgi:outer membrane putative beta-barrel porin/alpha-amylase